MPPNAPNPPPTPAELQQQAAARAAANKAYEDWPLPPAQSLIVLQPDLTNLPAWKQQLQQHCLQNGGPQYLDNEPGNNNAIGKNARRNILLAISATVDPALKQLIFTATSAVQTYQAILALAPDADSQIEEALQLLNGHTIETSPTTQEYLTTHANVQASIHSIDPTHHHASPAQYARRLLSGTHSVPALQYLRAKYHDQPATSFADCIKIMRALTTNAVVYTILVP